MTDGPSSLLVLEARGSFFFFLLHWLYPRKIERLIVDSIVSYLLKHLKTKIKLKNAENKFECLVLEMLFIPERKQSLNAQSDSIRAKLSIKKST